MAFKTVRLNHRAALERRARREKKFPSVTREDIEKATKQYLNEGGKISRVEPEWIVEGSLYILR